MPGYEILSIKVSSSSPDTVFAGTYERGLWRTTNGGIDWNYVVLSGNTINCIVSDPNNFKTFYFGSGEWIKNPDNEWTGVFRTTDGGATFNTVRKWADGGANGGMNQVNCIFVDPDNSNNIYVGGLAAVNNFGMQAFQYSTDGGDHWTDKLLLSPTAEIQKVVAVKDTSGQLTVCILANQDFSTSNTKLYKSSDLGDNWEEVVNPYTSDYDPQMLMTDPINHNIIYIGTHTLNYPVLIYQADKDKWNFISGDGLTLANSTCIDISNETNPEIYTGSSFAGFYSFTKGVSSRWTRKYKGLNTAYINDIAASPSQPDLVYTCTNGAYGLFVTSDGGSNWSLIPSGSPNIITVDPQDQSIIYAATSLQSGGSYLINKIVNSGVSWIPIQFTDCSGNDCSTVVKDLLVDPANSQNLLVATDYQWMSDGMHGFGSVFRSTNGGNNWDELLSAPATALTLDPGNPDIVYCGKRKAGQIWKIENAWGTANTTELTPADGIGDIMDIELDNSSNVYVATTSGLLKYSSGNWTILTLPSTDITSLAVDRSISPNMIYAGTGDYGIFISKDAGSTWHEWNDGLKNYTITKLRISGSKVWVGTEYGGVWCRSTAQSISSPYITLNTGDLTISIFQDGSIGHLSSMTNLGDGCRFKNNADALFAAGLIFGTKSGGYVNGNQASFQIVNDFDNTEKIHEVISQDPETDYITETAYNDNGAVIPYGVLVSQDVYSKSSDDFVILKFGFTSVSSNLNDFYAGIFADWDVGGPDGYSDNLGGYDSTRNLAYQYIADKSPDPNYYGIAALSGMAGALITTEGGSMREAALQRISNFKNEAIADTNDYRMWIGSGPFTIMKGDTKFAYFAIVAGTDLADLQSNTDAAADKYQHIITGVIDKDETPEQYYLSQNYPNPFNPVTTIRYQIPAASFVTIKVFDILGREIKVLVNEKKKAGSYKINFDGSNLSSNVYFYRMQALPVGRQAGSFVSTKKFVLLK